MNNSFVIIYQEVSNDKNRVCVVKANSKEAAREFMENKLGTKFAVTKVIGPVREYKA